MARPKRTRIISTIPKCVKFCAVPANGATVLTMEELEAIRLMDYLSMTHDEAATLMHISRTTVTEIYEQARIKIAKALCEGNDLLIAGGTYTFVSNNDRMNNISVKKEGNKMRIAVTYENGQVFGHFGHTETFKIYEVENKKVLSSEVVPTNGAGHGALATFLKDHDVNLLICGGIGGGAINALAAANIPVLPGVCGCADDAVTNYLNETLVYDPNAKCSHHEHEHGEGHECHCGDHGHHCHHEE